MIYIRKGINIEEFVESKGMEKISDNIYRLEDKILEDSIMIDINTRTVQHTGFEYIICKWLDEGYLTSVDPKDSLIFPQTITIGDKEYTYRSTYELIQHLDSFINYIK